MIKTGYMEASQHYRAAPVVTKVIYTYGVSFFRLSMDCNMMTCIVWTTVRNDTTTEPASREAENDITQ